MAAVRTLREMNLQIVKERGFASSGSIGTVRLRKKKAERLRGMRNVRLVVV